MRLSRRLSSEYFTYPLTVGLCDAAKKNALGKPRAATIQARYVFECRLNVLHTHRHSQSQFLLQFRFDLTQIVG